MCNYILLQNDMLHYILWEWTFIIYIGMLLYLNTLKSALEKLSS